MNKKIEAFWQSYLGSLPEGSKSPSTTYEAWHFCDNEKDANELAQLVLAGIKTATCSMVWSYEAEGEELPTVGDLSIITDWEGKPQCIIETCEARVRAYNEVGADFAHDEGEGDRSLGYWRRVHWEAFSRECAEIGREPEKSMPLLCERFRVVFP